MPPPKKPKPQAIPAELPDAPLETPWYQKGARGSIISNKRPTVGRKPIAELDETYDEDVFVPEAQPAPVEPPAFTQANAKQLNDVLRELASRRKEALRIYRPYPNQEAFHASRARKKLAVGGNRGGKTLVCAAEIGRALTRQDPHNKYPDRPMRWIFVGKDLIHCSKVMYRKLFKPGAFPILRDPQTEEWRSFDPAADAELEHRCSDASPFVPPRFIKSVSWEDKKEEIARTVKLVEGTECTFFSGEGEPPQGWDADGVWLDEEIGHPKWFSEMVPRLVDKGGVLIWSFTPQIGSPAAYDLMNQAELCAADENPPVEKFFFNIDTNVYISDARREAFKADMAHDEEEYRVRVEGKSALEGQRVYGEFAPNGIHKCPTFVVPEDWTRYVYIDPGRQVAAALFFAVPPPGSEHSRHESICYDEIYHKKANAVTFAKVMKQHVGETWIQGWVIDGHEARKHETGSGKSIEQQYTEAFLAEGMAANGFKYFTWGADDLDSGIMAVKGKLQIVDGYPRFVFMEENLRWLKWEMGRYANRKLSRVNVITDKPEKRHDHLCDCLRYAAQHPMPHVPPPKRKRPRSWTEAYLKKKKQKKLSDAPGGGGICCF